ncbi:hypothetical protein GALMADRAFT_64217 [Galerina marginata CBS 339.88]|uniref:XPG-I domain-containing protein n=1 Tax=Galerina marginata (strain CBS 339.88) TaxID=685588 RepID=A0A067TG80_GALM3|nr:hypothetical protein GALMADRAFT_64217 [Galerina marginata CBS 339.88]
MGVPGLWDILRPAAKTRSLTDLAIKDGFESNTDGKRGFRIGVDASIWFFHAECGREGENPVLRTLFFRCAILMRTTFLPIFVFDGPKRPKFKRGKRVSGGSHALVPGMKQIVEAFGFEWRTAPGEAEAELAYLNNIGVIDAILSDDVDNFLFGAKTVIRNPSNTLSGNRSHPILNSAGKDDKNHTRIFRFQDIAEHPDIRLSRGGMILIGLMSGGDYQQAGLMRCGPTISHGLAKCGFGDGLYEAAINLDRQELAEFLVAWRHDVCQELRTNSKGEIGRKQVALANSITGQFPDIDTLLSYVRPVTSENTAGGSNNNAVLTWSKEPDLVKLAALCEQYFEWGYRESIIKRFRTLIWPPIMLRILRRAVLDRDSRQKAALPGTPKENMNHPGTPSKMVARHFSSLATPSNVYLSGSESEEDEDEKLIIKIHSSRTHVSTDGLLEYRLEISPKQLIDLAESGVQGIRAPPLEPDGWATEDEDYGEGAGVKKSRGKTIDPESHLRVWMPACIVELAEPRLVRQFEGVEEKKRLKKVTQRVQTDKPTKKGKKRATTKTVNDSQDVFSSPLALAKPKKSQVASKKQGLVESARDDEMPDAGLLPHMRVNTGGSRDLHVLDTLRAEDQPPKNPLSSSVRSRSGIRDLTKKNPPSQARISANNDLKSFFPVTHSLKNTSVKPDNSVPSTSRVLQTTKPLANLAGSSKSTTRPTQTASLNWLHDSDDSSWEEYNPMLWDKTGSLGTQFLSPSKRKARASSNSDSESRERLVKSPRKKVGHTSANTNQRPASPSPLGSLPSGIRKACNEVIDITDSDSDSTLPGPSQLFRSVPVTTSRKLLSKTTATPKMLHKKAAQPLVSSDIIDLT